MDSESNSYGYVCALLKPSTKDEQQHYYASSNTTPLLVSDSLDTCARLDVIRNITQSTNVHFELSDVLVAIQTQWRNEHIEEYAISEIVEKRLCGELAIEDAKMTALTDEDYDCMYCDKLENYPAFGLDFCPIASIYTIWIAMCHFGEMLYRPIGGVDATLCTSPLHEFEKYFLPQVEHIVISTASPRYDDIYTN